MDDLDAAFMVGAVEGDATGIGLNVGVEAEAEQELDGIVSRLFGPFVGDAFDPTDARGDCERSDVEDGVDFGVG